MTFSSEARYKCEILLCEESTALNAFTSCFTVHYHRVSNGGRTCHLLSEAVFSNTCMFYERLLHCYCLLYVGQAYLAYPSWSWLLNKMLIESCVPHSSCTQPEESGTGLQKGSSFMGATENKESSRRKTLCALKPAIQHFFAFLSLSVLPLHCKIGLL